MRTYSVCLSVSRSRIVSIMLRKYRVNKQEFEIIISLSHWTVAVNKLLLTKTVFFVKTISLLTIFSRATKSLMKNIYAVVILWQRILEDSSCKFAVYFQNTFSQEHLWVAAFVASKQVFLVWLTSNYMLGSGNFWDTSPSWFWKFWNWAISKFCNY